MIILNKSLNRTLEEDGLLLVDSGIDQPKLVPRTFFPVIDGAVTREFATGSGIRLVDALLDLDRNVGTEGYVIPERKKLEQSSRKKKRNNEKRFIGHITNVF